MNPSFFRQNPAISWNSFAKMGPRLLVAANTRQRLASRILPLRVWWHQHPFSMGLLFVCCACYLFTCACADISSWWFVELGFRFCSVIARFFLIFSIVASNIVYRIPFKAVLAVQIARASSQSRLWRIKRGTRSKKPSGSNEWLDRTVSVSMPCFGYSVFY